MISSINPQPITKQEIQENNPRIERIYSGKKGKIPEFKAIAKKNGGASLGTLFEKARSHTSRRNSKQRSQWVGKVGMPTGRLKNDPTSFRTCIEKDINLDTIREKLGYDLNQELGRKIFRVPKNLLSYQPILDKFNLNNSMALVWSQSRIKNSLRIMSRCMIGYSDFKDAKVTDNNLHISFIDYLKKYHRPPSSLFVSGEEVPLKGIMGMLAVGRALADSDIIGGLGGNAGFVCLNDANGKAIEAQTVKIDPGECFKFKIKEEFDKNGNIYPSENWVLNAKDLRINSTRLLDLKDLQIAQCDDSVTIYWNALTPEQKDEFLGTLFNCSRYLHADEILKYLFFRDGKFLQNNKVQIPPEIALQFKDEMKEWLLMQLNIYHTELASFQIRHIEQVLCVQYIDRYGELSLPTSNQTFPIRELFVPTAFIEHYSPKSRQNIDKGAEECFRSQEISKIAQEPQISNILKELLEILRYLENRSIEPSSYTSFTSSTVSTTLGRLGTVALKHSQHVNKPVFLEMLKDHNHYVCEAAITAFSEVDRGFRQEVPIIINALLKMLKDDALSTRTLAISTIDKMAKIAHQKEIDHIVINVVTMIDDSNPGKKETAIIVLGNMARLKSAKEYLPVIIGILYENLKDTDKFVRHSIFNLLSNVLEISNQKQSSDIIKRLLIILNESNSFCALSAMVLSKVPERLTKSQISEIITMMLEVLKYPNFSCNDLAFTVLDNMLPIADTQFVNKITENLLGLLRDANIYNQQRTAILTKVIKVLPKQNISSLLRNLQREGTYDYAHQIFSQISLKNFIECFALTDWDQVATFFIEIAMKRNGPLYIQEIKNVPHLCVIENIQIIRQSITHQQVDFLKTRCIKETSLNSYTESYL